MDDEELIRTLVQNILELSGYRPVTCEDGASAVELYREALERGEPFSAVITDLTVPGGMGGVEAAREILALDPGACLIVSSGYCQDPVMADPGAYGFQAAVGKPYRIDELKRTLQIFLPRGDLSHE
jgi:CheY-like chemotaxis protein